MKNKILFSFIFTISILITTGCFGLKEYEQNEVDSYLQENFPNQKYTISEKYEKDIKGNNGDSWSIEEIWDIELDDDNLKFQVYNYRLCGVTGCENYLYNNYDYVYGNYYLEKYNKNNNLNLIIEKDDESDIYIRYNTYAKIYYETEEELELIKEKITKFQKYLNNNTKKNIELIVYIYDSNDSTKKDRMEIN